MLMHNHKNTSRYNWIWELNEMLSYLISSMTAFMIVSVGRWLFKPTSSCLSLQLHSSKMASQLEKLSSNKHFEGTLTKYKFKVSWHPYTIQSLPPHNHDRTHSLQLLVALMQTSISSYHQTQLMAKCLFCSICQGWPALKIMGTASYTTNKFHCDLWSFYSGPKKVDLWRMPPLKESLSYSQTRRQEGLVLTARTKTGILELVSADKCSANVVFWTRPPGAGFYLNATNPTYSKHYNMLTHVTVELPQAIEAAGIPIVWILIYVHDFRCSSDTN